MSNLTNEQIINLRRRLHPVNKVLPLTEEGFTANFLMSLALFGVISTLSYPYFRANYGKPLGFIAAYFAGEAAFHVTLRMKYIKLMGNLS